MNRSNTRILGTVASALLALAAGQPALADDTEIFFSQTNVANSGQPNILLIVDTSGSMITGVTSKVPYDPFTTFTGTCDPNRIYYKSSSGNPPDCSTSQWVNRSAFLCQSGLDGLALAGIYSDRAAQYDSALLSWLSLDSADKASVVECRGDRGIHGDGASSRSYATNGGTYPWSSSQGDEVSWSGPDTGVTYTFYSANYINWFYDPTITTTRSRNDIVKDVTAQLLNSVKNVNVGLMRFQRVQGGVVLHPVNDIQTDRGTMQSIVASLPADGFTPLSETLYESYLYYTGSKIRYGDNADPFLTVDTARSKTDRTVYRSPGSPDLECQKNYIVLLTDGAPTEDVDADALITGLPNFSSLTGRSTCDPNPSAPTDPNGACLDDLAHYLFEADLDPVKVGRQYITTYTIGFDVDLPLLQNAAARGGGEYFVARDTATLAVALTNIIREIIQDNTSFVSPAVSVNTFNRTQTLDDLYVAVFRPASEEEWPGNLKKYRFSNGEIVGLDGTTSVVDPTTGFFKDNAHSIWSASVDGSDASSGGAASRIPDPGQRRVYTNLVAGALSAVGNQVRDANATLMNFLATDQRFVNLTNTTTYDDTTNCPSRACDIVRWARDVDINDDDQDQDFADQRFRMGDPLHSRPVSVVYGGTVSNPDNRDGVLFFSTNNGYLHAIDPKTGEELWSFVPQSLLKRLANLFDNNVIAQRSYGLDASIRAVKIDRNQNGIVEPTDGDKVFLFFGMRRGGRQLFALDVTDRNNPVEMWRKGAADYPLLGQTWSNPVPARVNISGATQNAGKLVLVFGGGYDSVQDAAGYNKDGLGTGIYIVDALSGSLLWRAGPDPGATLRLTAMTNSIPADVRALDLNFDGFADHLYASDSGGRLWRIDLRNGNTAAGLATGGVIATLGGTTVAKPAAEAVRRFYYAPDTALIRDGSGTYLNIAIGSGWRAHPLDETVHDQFFSVRDYKPYRLLTQAEFGAITPATVNSLVNVTTTLNPVIPPGAAGWRIELNQPAWQGEKVLAESRTFADTVFFTTYTPTGNPNPCLPGRGVNKLYAVNVKDGSPVVNLDGVGSDDPLTLDDRVRTLAQGGIAPEIVFLFPDPNSCTSNDCERVYGFVGLEGIGGLNLPPFVRTFWNQAGTE